MRWRSKPVAPTTTRQRRLVRMAAGAADADRLAVAGMLALAAALGIGRFVFTPALPHMAEALALTSSQAGLIASANFLGYLLGALTAALPGLPGPKRRWLMGGLAVSAATTLLMAVPSGLGSFLALRFVGGGASAVVIVFASQLVLDGIPSSGRTRAASIHFAGVGAGMAMSAIGVAVSLALGGGWRSLWTIAGLVSLVFTVAVAALVPGGFRLDGDGARVPARVAPQRDDHRARAAFIAAYGLFGFGYVVTATFLVAIVRATPDMRASEPYVWLVSGLAALPSVAMWTRIGSRLGTGPAFALACAVEALGVLCSVLWAAVAGAFVSAALLGGTFMGLTALGLAGVRQASQGDSRRALAVATASFGFGQMTGPAVAGLMHDAAGSFVGPSIAAAGALALAAVLAAAHGRARSQVSH